MKNKIIILMLLSTLILTGCKDKNKDIDTVNETPTTTNHITPTTIDHIAPTTDPEPSPVVTPVITPTPSLTPSPTELPPEEVTPSISDPSPSITLSIDPTVAPTTIPTKTPTSIPTNTPTKAPSPSPLDQLLSYQVEIEGESYQLPFSFRKLRSKGWTIKNEIYEPYDFSRSLYALESTYLLLSKGDKNIYLSLINGGTQKSNKYDEFLVYTVAGDVTLPGGIIIGSSLDDVLELYGKPKDLHKIDNIWVRLPYVNPVFRENNEFHPSKGIELYAEREKITSIQLINFDANVEDYVVQIDKPFSYTKPTALSNNILDFSFKFGEQYFSIPAPMSEFLDQGYTMKGYSYSELPTIDAETLENLWKPSKVLAPQNTIYAVLEKGKSIVLTELRNEYDTYQYYKDCTVTKVRFLQSKNAANATLSGAIKIGSSEADVVNALKEQPYARYTGKQVSGFFINSFYGDNESWIRYESYVFTEKLSSSKKNISYVGSMTYDLLDGKVIDITYHHLNKGTIGTVNRLDLITPGDADKERFQFTDEELMDYLCYRGNDYNYWQETNYAMIFGDDGSYHAYDAAAGNPWLLLYGDMVDGEATFTVDAMNKQIIIYDYERTITLHYTIGSSFELIIRIDDNPREYYFYRRP